MKFLFFILGLLPLTSWAIDPEVNLKVWTNEAIINVYSFSDQTWENRQKDMAAYFLPSAWSAYLNAINQSNILKLVKQHHMTVSAVATLPPSIKKLSESSFAAHLPILVEYKSSKTTQVQYLSIDLEIVKSPSSHTRGYAINRFNATLDSAPCRCTSPSPQPKVTIV